MLYAIGLIYYIVTLKDMIEILPAAKFNMIFAVSVSVLIVLDLFLIIKYMMYRDRLMKEEKR